MFTVTDETARYDADEFSLKVQRNGTDLLTGKPAWAYSVTRSEKPQTVVIGTDLFGWGDSREMLRSLASFLYADAELYRRHMGPITEPYEDGYLFGHGVAEWAYMNDDELALINQDGENDE